MTAPHQNLLGSGAVADTEETDPNFNQTILLLHGDGTNGGTNNTFVDSSSYNQTIARSGTATQGTVNPFMGDGQYSRYTQANSTADTHGSGVTLGTNNFTIGMFVYPIGCDNVMGQALNAGGDSRTALYADTGADTFILAHDQLLVNAGSTWTITINFTTVIALYQWQWIQVDRTGNTFRVSIDGSYVDSGGATSSGSVPAINTGTFGKRAGQDNYFGYYNNFILINGANRGSITPPTTSLTADSNTAILLHQSNRFVNNGNTSATLVSGSDNKIVPFSPLAPTASYSESVHGGSGYFGGSGNLLTITGSASSDFHLASNAEWCVEFWVYMINPTGSYARVMQINHGDGWAIRFDASTGKIGIGRSDAGSTETLEDPTALPSHTWTHFAFTNKNQSGTYHLRLFRNGTQVATTSGWSIPWTNKNSTLSEGNLRIAGYYSSAGSPGDFPGIMYLGTTRLVQGDYIYDSTFTPPTEPLSSTGTGTKLLLNFTNASVIDQTMKNNIETVGDAQLDTTVKKFGTASIEFPSGDALQYDSGKGLALGTGPFTVEFFVRFIDNVNADGADGNNSRASIVRSVGTGSGSMVIQRYNGGSGGTSDPQWRVGTETDPEIKASQNLSNGVFYHVAMTRDSSNKLRLFVDGTMLGSDTSFTQNFPENDFYFANFGRGGGSSRFLNGFLDEIRITKGIARYDSDSGFTAPTIAFKDK